MDHLAFLFEEVGKIEREHENRYRKLLANVEGGLVLDVYKRQEQALERTRTRRPDLYEKYEEKSMAKIDK